MLRPVAWLAERKGGFGLDVLSRDCLDLHDFARSTRVRGQVRIGFLHY